MMTLALEDETFPALIVDVDPPHLFSYRWAMGHPGQRPTDQNSTLVQFVITPDGDGTVLQVIESGFATANIPADRTEKASAEFHAQGGVLDAAGLVHGQKQGRERRYEVRTARLSETARWMDELASQWDTRLAAIKRIAES